MTPDPTPVPAPIPPPNQTRSDKFINTIIKSGPAMMYLIIAITFLTFLIYLVARPTNITATLGDPQAARGIITVLIAVTTVITAFILLLFVISSSSDEEVTKRFDAGKQILSVFVGILGTIVGFYFGSTSPSAPLTAVASKLVPSTVHVGDHVDLSVLVTGGKAPYTMAVTFNPDLKLDKTLTSPGGTASYDFVIPDSATLNQPIKCQIVVKDSSSGSVTIADDKQSFTVLPKAP